MVTALVTTFFQAKMRDAETSVALYSVSSDVDGAKIAQHMGTRFHEAIVSLAKARDSFEQALAVDPDYAPAHAGLAVFYYGLGALGIKPMTETAPLAKSAAQRALAIDPALAEAHSVLGLVAGSVEYDWPSAECHFQAAMVVEPVPPLVHVRYALYFLTPQRRFAEAVAHYQRALETDPLSMMVHYGLAFALYCQRRYDEAIEHAARALTFILTTGSCTSGWVWRYLKTTHCNNPLPVLKQLCVCHHFSPWRQASWQLRMCAAAT